jgi:acyl-CoA hydrolase
MRIVHSAAEAANLVRSDQQVFVHGSAATRSSLLAALLARAGELHGIELVAISTLGEIDWKRPAVHEHLLLKSLFVSANVREWVDRHGGDYVPVFLSEIPTLFRERLLPIDVALLQVSPPDKHGFCSLGTSIDAALAAAQEATTVLAEINPRMPRTLGDSHIHVSRITAAVNVDRPLPEVSYAGDADAATEKIGRAVAGLVEDGSTLQMGIGGIPDAVLRSLSISRFSASRAPHAYFRRSAARPMHSRRTVTRPRLEVDHVGAFEARCRLRCLRGCVGTDAVDTRRDAGGT